ncbi:MAG: sulfotransferase domain-containing protein [Phycisphaerales bacterium]|nr:sulfotransferase domain-containing protein [Phycisphaerales bacterium]
MWFTRRKPKAGTAATLDKVEGTPASSPSGVAWSDELRQDLADARLSVDPPNAATFQGRECRFFFITGVGKSGTNWLGNVLNLHPAVYVDPGEFQFQLLWEQGLRTLCEPSWQSGHYEPYRQAARMGIEDTVRRMMLAGIGNKPGVRFIGDKSPRPFSVLVPGCPIINLVRDGRDVIISYTYHYLRLKPGNIQWWPDELKDRFPRFAEDFHKTEDDEIKRRVAKQLLSEEWWVRFVANIWARQVAEDRKGIFEASADSPETPVMTLRYEDLHADFNPVRSKVYKFIGADPALAAGASHKSRTLPGFKQERVMNFYRKGQPGDWEHYRNDVFDRVVDECAGEALVAEGYGRDANRDA